jgi:hypothetical protein
MIAPLMILIGVIDLIITLSLVIFKKLSLTLTLVFAFLLFIVFSIIYYPFLLSNLDDSSKGISWGNVDDAFLATFSMWGLVILYITFRLKAYLD